MSSPNALRIQSNHQAMEFDPSLGGRAVSWLVDGRQMLVRASDDPIEFGMYSMAPWAGRVRGNAIASHQIDPALEPFVHELRVNNPPWALHGVCLDAPIDSWEQVSDACVRMSQRIPGWPATLLTEWRIDGWIAVSTLTVEADLPVPALMGWHPWFPASVDGQPARWSLTGSMAVRDGAFPSGELREWTGGHRVDDAFLVPDGCVRIDWGSIALTIQNSDPWYVVYDEREDALCVEPQNGPPNAFEKPVDGSAPIARAGSPRVLKTEWTWGR